MSSSPARGKGTAFLVLLVLLFGGTVAVFDGFIVRQSRLEQTARDTWDEVSATIVESRVLREWNTQRVGSRSSPGAGSSYRPLVRYAYQVDGVEFESSRYAFGMNLLWNRSFSRRVVAEHPVGSSVTARVDPEDPESAVLRVDGSARPRFVLVFLIPFHCLPLWLLARLFLSRRRRGLSRIEARFVMVDTENDLVLAKVPGHPVSVFLAFAGILGFVATLVLALGVGFPGADELAIPALGTIAILASLGTAMVVRRTRRPARFLHVDLDRWSFAYPADGERTPLPKSPSLGVSSTETNTSVNNERIHEHQLVLENASEGEVTVFRFRGPESDGPALLEVLRDRLRPGGG